MQAPRHAKGLCDLFLVVVIERGAAGHEARHLPACFRVLVHERVVEPQFERGLERERLRPPIDDLVRSRPWMAVHVALPAAREVEREVGHPLLERLHVQDVAATAAQRRADVVQHARSHVVDELGIEVLQLVRESNSWMAWAG